MKGISEVIAIVLILMITIALAALAYTWFSGIFATMTGTASTAVTGTTTAMNTQFSIDSAKGSGTGITLVIRNTGTTSINQSFISGYTSDQPCSGTGPTTPLLATNTFSSPIGLTNCLSCTCTNKICYLANGNIETLTVTIGSGLQQIATVTC